MMLNSRRVNNGWWFPPPTIIINNCSSKKFMAAWDLTFLGTGSAYPSPHRAASCMVLRSDVGCWMFDCGEGSQIQLMRSSIRPGRLTKIFITHLHGDHMFGLPGLVCSLNASLSVDGPPLEIYGPVGLRQFVRVALNLARSQLDYSYLVHELLCDIHPGEYDGKLDWSPDHNATGQPHPKELPGRMVTKNSEGFWNVCREGSLTVTAAILKHRIPCFGFVINEDPLPGRVLVEKLKALGVPPGPLYAKLKKGEEIESPTGLKISPSDVLAPPRPGRRVVILGDTCDSSDMIPIARGADLVVHEATNENSHEIKCQENGHSTPRMAVAFCRLLGAKELILTHFSQRYKRSGEPLQPGEATVDRLLQEAEEAMREGQDGGSGMAITETNSEGFCCTVSVADDFRTYIISARK